MADTPLVQSEAVRAFNLGRETFAGGNHLGVTQNPHHAKAGHVDNCNDEKGEKHRKHTPIVSKKQQGKFGAEYARRKRGEKPQMKGITTAELKEHLQESKGKKLQKRSKKSKK